MKIARITNDVKLSIKGELIEFPKVLKGGINLIRDKDYSNPNPNVTYQDVTIEPDTFMGNAIYKVTKKSNGRPQINFKTITIKPNETYSFSVYAKEPENNGSPTTRFLVYSTGLLDRGNLSVLGEWQRISTIYTNETEEDITVHFYFYASHNEGTISYFSSPKLEKGDLTEWTPAPEDLGLIYPDWVQSFNTSFSKNGIVTQEYIEYPKEIEGMRNFFQMEYLSNRDNFLLNTYSTTKEVMQLRPNSEYVLHAEKMKAYEGDGRGVLVIADGTDGAIQYNTTGYKPIRTLYNRRSPYPSEENFSMSFTTPESGLVYFSFFDGSQGNSVESNWFTNMLVNPKLELASEAGNSDWTPAPEDLGLGYSSDIQYFNMGIKDNMLMATELIEGGV